MNWELKVKNLLKFKFFPSFLPLPALQVVSTFRVANIDPQV
jgi:hypothetical protein